MIEQDPDSGDDSVLTYAGKVTIVLILLLLILIAAVGLFVW